MSIASELHGFRQRILCNCSLCRVNQSQESCFVRLRLFSQGDSFWLSSDCGIEFSRRDPTARCRTVAVTRFQVIAYLLSLDVSLACFNSVIFDDTLIRLIILIRAIFVFFETLRNAVACLFFAAPHPAYEYSAEISVFNSSN